ncbi:hypothetical protein [Aquimarina brevivitae]|uniref:Outer membrane protein with beta-barrel domain n=1 Tax=Aquimarina brevivitae TaxID=323412 RepID=A0A4V2F7L4_9FLAO|nr:hypothetical protein [Aquimarina brevivitae]RZT00230.1 hypothetical protein EV197_1466 [Aquimarina brevivitae]
MRFKRYLIGLLLSSAVMATAQYEPQAWNYGLTSSKTIGIEAEVGFGVRIEYAPNCYTTYMAEYNRSFDFGDTEEDLSFNELALGVNLILFNWYPTTITAGMGYVGNNSKLITEDGDDAFLVISSETFNHGAQIKLRALHQVAIPIHIFAELNLKSLGNDFHTVLIGFSYDFNAR